MQKTQDRWFTPFWARLLLTVLAVGVVGLVVYGRNSAIRMNAVYAPLIDAAMEIELHTTVARLRLEETLQHPDDADMRAVRESLDQADWYAHAMLEGGTSPEGEFIALNDAQLRQVVSQVRQAIADAMAATRQYAVRQAQSDGKKSQELDALFIMAVHSADELETRLQEVMARDLRRFRVTQGILIITCLVLALVVGTAFGRLGALRKAALREAQQANEWLRQEINERLRVEQQREELIAELEDKNAELERFSYSVSHDLKSPLITIQGFVGVLLEDAMEGNVEHLRAHVDHIKRAVETMGRLLDELLELSRVGRLADDPQEVSLGELAHEAVNLIAGQIRERGVEVTIASDLPLVVGDPPRLREVFQNLIDNAVKYMGDQPDPRIEIGARQEGDNTVCYVSDNGTGIESPYQEKIFALFEQLNPSHEGTGIGLALAKRIVEVHGGRIWVESAGLGSGSTFCFTIPT